MKFAKLIKLSIANIEGVYPGGLVLPRFYERLALSLNTPEIKDTFAGYL